MAAPQPRSFAHKTALPNDPGSVWVTRIETGRAGAIHSPGDREDPALVVEYVGQAAWRGSIRYRTVPPSARPSAWKSFDFTAAAADRSKTPSARVRLEKPDLLGLHVVELEWKREGESVTTHRTRVTFVSLHPAGPTPAIADRDSFRLGLANGARIEPIDWIIEVAATVGAKIVRMSDKWPAIERHPGQFRWEAMDRIVDQAERRGMDVQVTVGQSPPWAVRSIHRESKWPRKTAPRIDRYERFLTRFATRYRGRVRYWEILNEPDIDFFRGTIDEYLQIFDASHRVLKRVDSGNVVMSGGFTGFSHPRRKVNFQETVLKTRGDRIDTHTLHLHGYFKRVRSEMETAVLPFRRRNKIDAPLYFNETGMDTRLGETDQAETLVKKIAYLRSAGAIGYTWYSVTDHPRSRGKPRQAGLTYGLYTADRQPKAALAAFSTCARLIAGPRVRYIDSWDLGAGRLAYRFRNDSGDDVLVAWVENRQVSDCVITVTNQDRRPVRQVDAMGNPIESLPVGDAVGTRLKVAQTPTFILLGKDATLVNVTAEPGSPSGAEVTTVSAGRDAPIFEIRRVASVRNRFEHDPNTADRLWTGPSDCGCQVWIRPGDGLHVRVEVSDDVHRRGGFAFGENDKIRTGESLLRGDGIEVYLRSIRSGRQTHFVVGTDPNGRPVLRDLAGIGDPSDRPVAAVRRTDSVTEYRLDIPGDRTSLPPATDEILTVNLIVYDRDDPITANDQGWESKLMLAPWPPRSQLPRMRGRWIRLPATNRKSWRVPLR